MQKNRKLIAFCLIAMVSISLGIYWFTVGKYLESTDNAYIQSDIFYISSKESGFTEAGWIKDNQRVHKGDELARIRQIDFQLMVDEKLAAVHSSQANIVQLKSQRALQQSLIKGAKAEQTAAKADLTLAHSELQRLIPLRKKNYVSQDKLDNARTTQKKAEALLQGKAAKLESSHRQLVVLDSQINAAKATLAQAKSRLDIAKQQLKDTVITAPEDGIIGQRQVKNGHLVKAGSVLFTLVDTSTVWVTANFKETQIQDMHPGQPVELDIDAFPGQPVTGYIDSIKPASGARFSLLPPENATGNFTKIVQRIPVKIAIPATQRLAGRLVSGMSVEVNVDTREEPVDTKNMQFSENNLAPEQSAFVAGA